MTLILGFAAHADWNGVWSGDLTYKSSGLSDTVAKGEVKIATSYGAFLVIEEASGYKRFVIDQESGTLRVENPDAYEDGYLPDPVGTITDDAISVRIESSYVNSRDEEVFCVEAFEVERIETGIHFHHYAHCMGGRSSGYASEGELIPQTTN